jgi:hypothetical protein
MNKAWTRRAVIVSVAAAAAGGLVVVEGPRLLRKRHAPTPYDDLFALLDDRDACAQIGEAVLAGWTNFNAAAVAADLRRRLRDRKLADVAAEDAAAGRVTETSRWVIPDVLALLCALAAKVG